jgi:hypothetical protein
LVIFVEKDGEQLVETGEILGSLTDEVLGETGDPSAYICEAGFLAPKSYYTVTRKSDGSQIVSLKAKGFTLHDFAMSVLNKDSAEGLITHFPTPSSLEVPQCLIQANERNEIHTIERNKTFKIVGGKRALDDNGTTLPFGYKRMTLE